MSDFNIKQNDRLPALTSTLKYADGSAINLTGATLKFLFRKPDGTIVDGTGTLTVVDAVTGQVKYEWASGDTSLHGIITAEWEITFPGSKKLTVPNRGTISILVSPELVAA